MKRKIEASPNLKFQRWLRYMLQNYEALMSFGVARAGAAADGQI
jgi:hypothetical protein